MFEKLPALSFSPGSILRIESDMGKLKIEGELTVEKLYNSILGKFEDHAVMKKRSTKLWSESWERFIPEALRLVKIIIGYLVYS